MERGRPLSQKRYESDRLLIKVLADGGRYSRDVIQEFLAQGFNKNDFRASRHRLGAEVKMKGKTQLGGGWFVYFPDGKPLREPRLCSPRRPRWAKPAYIHDEEVSRLKILLRSKIDEVSEFLGRMNSDGRMRFGLNAVPTAGIDGSPDGDMGWI